MAQYINKSALVVEIEKIRKNAWESFQKGNSTEKQYYIRYGVIQDILISLNTLEVKEVDLETVFAALIDHFDEKNKCGRWPESDLRDFAKHFIELGLKIQKGE